jgi:hypothetical protein
MLSRPVKQASAIIKRFVTYAHGYTRGNDFEVRIYNKDFNEVDSGIWGSYSPSEINMAKQFSLNPFAKGMGINNNLFVNYEKVEYVSYINIPDTYSDDGIKRTSVCVVFNNGQSKRFIIKKENLQHCLLNFKSNKIVIIPDSEYKTSIKCRTTCCRDVDTEFKSMSVNVIRNELNVWHPKHFFGIPIVHRFNNDEELMEAVEILMDPIPVSSIWTFKEGGKITYINADAVASVEEIEAQRRYLCDTETSLQVKFKDGSVKNIGTTCMRAKELFDSFEPTE